jgi:hypothetical protein
MTEAGEPNAVRRSSILIQLILNDTTTSNGTFLMCSAIQEKDIKDSSAFSYQRHPTNQQEIKQQNERKLLRI